MIHCERDSLRAALAACASAISGNSPHKVYQCALLSVDPDEGGPITLTATNGRIAIRRPVPGARGAVPGSMAIPAAKLGELLGKLPPGEVSIEDQSEGLDGPPEDFKGKAEIRRGKSSWTLALEDYRLFRETPRWEPGDATAVAGIDLAGALGMVLPACARKSTASHILRCVELGTAGGILRARGSGNGYGACARAACEGPDLRLILVPLKLAEALRALGDEAGTRPVLLRGLGDGPSGANCLVACAERIGEVAGMLGVGRYPAHEVRRDEVAFAIPARDLARAVERAAITAHPDLGIALEFAGAEIILTGEAPDAGRAVTRLPLAMGAEFRGPAIRVLPQALLAALGPLGEAEARFTLDPANPRALELAQNTLEAAAGGFLQYEARIELIDPGEAGAKSWVAPLEEYARP